jgi:hypothetical protein
VNLGTIDPTIGGAAMARITNQGNAGSGALVITASAGLSVTGCPVALAAGESCVATITALPTAVGTFAGSVSITANPGAVTPLLISVVATVGTGGLFGVSPASIDLGNLQVGAVAQPTKITITALTSISDLLVSTTGSEWSIDKVASTCTPALAAGTSCILVVNFYAVVAGSKSGSILISGGGPRGQTVSVPVTANAQNAARLVISPSSPQNFVASIGQTSVISFAVANAGDLPTGALLVAVKGASSFSVANTTCLILAPLAGCTATVAYKPVAITSAAETAMLTISDTGPGASSVTVPLAASNTGPPVGIVITPATTNLGSVLLGATGPATVFTVTNSGGSSSGVLTASLSSSEFVITNDTCTGIALVANSGCTIAIALKPATVGTKTATLSVSIDNGGSSGVKTLTGTGITGPSPAISPAALDFGSVALGTTSAAQTVTMKNYGGSSSGSFVIAKAGGFSAFPVSENSCTSPLAPAASCTFKVRFAPTTSGSQAASFTLSDGIVSATVAVSGDGILP